MIPLEITMSPAKPMNGMSYGVIIGDSISRSRALLKMMPTELPVSTRVLATLLVATFNVMTKASS